MLRTAVTVSLVPEARGGPFVFWDDLEAGCKAAAAAGFDAIELFAPSATAVDSNQLRSLLEKHRIGLAAVGTGAGMVRHGLTLTDCEAETRDRARRFVSEMIELGAEFAAPAIIGSMQGRSSGPSERPTAKKWLVGALRELGALAAERDVPLFLEPLNRYETDLCNTIDEGVSLLEEVGNPQVRLLADLFHMNIEERDIAQSLGAGREAIGHLHFVDSNRQAAGFGHLDFAPIAATLREIEYGGYASAEALPLPDSTTAAQQTIATLRRLNL